MADEDLPTTTQTDFELPATFRYSAFLDLLADAIFQHKHSHASTDPYTVNRFARASIIASALSVECAANCLIHSLDSAKLTEDLDKLGPIAKFETYLRIKQISGFDRGSVVAQRIVELIKARNDYVHPKKTKIPATMQLPQDGGKDWILPFNIKGEFWPGLEVPKRSMFWSSEHSLIALGTVVNFYSYIFVDLLGLEEHELHSLLPSHIEFQETRFLVVFEEIKDELTSIGNHGIDLSFLKIPQKKIPSND